MAERTVLLAAGGTGGHLFPAEALAHALIARGWSVHLATDDRAGRFAGGFPAAKVHVVPSATIAGRNPLALARALLSIWKGVRATHRIFEAFRPRAVVGFGGYPTLPPLLAASWRRLPTLIHEQNAVMGRANRLLAGRVTAIAGGFLPEGRGPHAGKTVLTGNPVRPAVLEASARPYAAPGPDGPFRLLVFGGSQGARYFSQAVPAAAALLPEALRRRLDVTQQARAEDEAEVRAAYAALGIAAEIAPFFADMAARIAAAHLVVARAGASTVSELAVIGRPSVLVPYPHALDHDQAANAAALAATGGAELRRQADLPPEALAGLVAALAADPARLETMAASARRAGHPDAARLLADLVEAIASGRGTDEFRGESRP